MTLWAQDATELARMIATREASSVEVVTAHLERIQAVNPMINAVVRVLGEEALTAARQADAVVADGGPLGPLHGVPFTVKENIDVAGTPTTWGLPALADALAIDDAASVARLKGAGSIVIGRTNVPDMALRAHTESSLHGLTRNPWNPEHTAGGSSGGEGAALATGMSPLGVGTDLGGSLRSPATACGIVSIRPTAGRVPDVTMIPTPDHAPSEQMMNTQGPMARSVRDLRLALRIMSGADSRDPWSVSAPFGAEAPPPCRVAMMTAPAGGSTDPLVANAVRRAGDALRDAGFDVVEAEPPIFEEVVAIWPGLVGIDLTNALPLLSNLMAPETLKLLAMADVVGDAPQSAAMLSELLVRRFSAARQWAQFFDRYPLLLCPAWTALPYRNGYDSGTPEGAKQTFSALRALFPANVLGLPSVCVPAAQDIASRLPIGVLVTGARFDDYRCLAAAEAIEARLRLPVPVQPAGQA